MCGRYALGDPDSLAARFGIVALIQTRITPRFNIAPSQQVPVVVGGPEGRALKLMRWGFQPAWMKQPKGAPPINARAETLAERPMFREAVARGRCIIPSTGFYEWVAAPGEKAKRPMHLRLKGGGLFGFAGLWTAAPDGEPTCAIVTTAANALIEPLHTRMPVILDPEDEALWLDPDLTEAAAVLAYLQALPPERMELYPVGPLVSSARNDGPELIEASSQPTLL